MEDLVSVIIPIFNTERYIKTCYLSVINQTYPNIEVILINDASLDGSDKVIKQLLSNTNKRDVQYHVFEQNRGVGYVRNYGISLAEGKYISFLDSDDWYDSNHISTMVDALSKHKGDIAICSILNEFDNYKSSSIRYFYDRTVQITGDYALKLLSREIKNDVYLTPMVGNKLFRKQFISNNKIYFTEDNCCEDDIFSFILFMLANTVVLVSGTHQHYRQREDSITHTFNKKRIDDLISSFASLKSTVKSSGEYTHYKKEFMSFFERCITTTYNSLINSKLSTCEKKKYIHYLIEQLIQNFSLKEIVDYLDIERFHMFLGRDC